MGRFRKSSATSHEFFDKRHRFEHWYRGNTLYFITSKCRDGFPAFDTQPARLVFRDRFYHYTKLHGFTPCVTTLLNNHYHSVGYLKCGTNSGR